MPCLSRKTCGHERILDSGGISVVENNFYDQEYMKEAENPDLEFECIPEGDGLDEQPGEGTALYVVMKANGILTPEDRMGYMAYDPSNPGCSIDKPILIAEAEDYVRLEYELLEYLLRPVPFRFVDYELEKQRLICHEGKYLDALTVRTYAHPLLEMDENGDFRRPEPTFLGTEEYWFDITAGYEAMVERLERFVSGGADGPRLATESEMASFNPAEE